MSKYNVGLKTLLLQGLSEPEFYGDLVYEFRKITSYCRYARPHIVSDIGQCTVIHCDAGGVHWLTDGLVL